MNKRIFGMSVNKFAAVTLSSFSIALLIAEMIIRGIAFGVSNLLSLSNILNYLLLFIAYIVLLVMNIRDNDNAYVGILALIVYVGVDAFYGVRNAFVYGYAFAIEGRALGAVFAYSSTVFYLGQLALGILSYIFILRYRMMRSDRFGKVMLFAVLFTIVSALAAGVGFAMDFLYSGGTSILTIALYWTLMASELIACIAMIFTLRRLRRY